MENGTMIRMLIILSVGVLCQQFAVAQTNSSKIPEPVLDGRAVYIHEDGSGFFLEQQRAEVHGGHSNLKGFASPIRLERDRIHEFIIRVDYSVDIIEYLKIFQLKHKSPHNEAKEHRYFHIPHHHAERIESLGFTYEKYGESSYKITLKQKLIPGEYAITYAPKVDDIFNLFGVD